MKRIGLVGLVVSSLCILTVVGLPVAPTVPAAVQLTILHTNDTHGHLLPFNYPETFDRDSVLARLSARRNIGGIARRAVFAAKIRKEPGRHVLLVDAGDICDGTPFSTEYRGEADVAAMNAAGYDIACPGNHEFNNTLNQVRKLTTLAKYPIVCANVATSTGQPPLFKPYVIKKIGPVRVAVFGLVTTDSRTYPAAREGLTIQSPRECARALVPDLRRQADIVVALTHSGMEQDRELAVGLDGVDAVIGGHSHTYLAAPLLIGQVPGPDAHSINGTIITHNFEWGAMLGRLDLRLSRGSSGKWAVSRYSGWGIPVTASLPSHAPTAQAVARYWNPIRAKYGHKVGSATADFTQKGPDSAEYNLVSDAVRARMGTEVGLENVGGVRAPLTRGPITYGDLVTVDPFGNTIVTMRMTGAQLLKILAERKPAVSGVRYHVRGSRIVSALVAGQPVDAAKTYSIVTNSFFARDPLFAEATERKDTGTARLDVLTEYIRAAGTVKPAYDRRRIVESVATE
ncbi:MAG: bifunctional metallophosphatase/5'-nucleotidase [Armatimonadetes bacterium]|nr:bifunctional metallophosphatase/5'-nucleotidase [Armatimonadota bacterium]